MGNEFREVLAAQDVATYGGLCALASFDRTELRRHVVENVVFLEYLELCPEVCSCSHWYCLTLHVAPVTSFLAHSGAAVFTASFKQEHTIRMHRQLLASAACQSSSDIKCSPAHAFMCMGDLWGMPDWCRCEK